MTLLLSNTQGLVTRLVCGTYIRNGISAEFCTFADCDTPAGWYNFAEFVLHAVYSSPQSVALLVAVAPLQAAVPQQAAARHSCWLVKVDFVKCGGDGNVLLPPGARTGCDGRAEGCQVQAGVTRVILLFHNPCAVTHCRTLTVHLSMS